MIYGNKDEELFFKEALDSITHDGRLLYVGNILKRAAHIFDPGLVALIFRNTEITYKDLYQRACSLAKFLKTKGLKKRDRVLVCFENSPDFYTAYFAVLQSGAIVAPLNTFLKETELSHIIKDAQPQCIITNSDRMHLFKSAQIHGAPIITEQDFPPSEKCSDNTTEELEPDEMAALLYTSGTTGLPKGVMLSSRNIIINILQSLSRLQLGHGERLFGILPLFHVFAQNACVWSAFFVGATVILIPKIDRTSLLDGLEHKPTGFLGVPALYGLLCLLKTAPLDSVKFFISGGDAMPDKIRTYFELLYRRKICNGYGLTETSPVLTFDCDDIAQPTHVIGKPLIGVACEIRDEKGAVLPHGQIGELWVKGDNIMLGYYNESSMTSQVLRNGWLNTGDMVYIDATTKKLLITGRTKDLIIHKGINIYPQEIENVILSHHNVIRVGVVGKQDNAYGEIPIAFVQLRHTEEGIEDTLKTLCNHQLATYKVPRSFICSIDELPITATGKVDKKILRKKLV